MGIKTELMNSMIGQAGSIIKEKNKSANSIREKEFDIIEEARKAYRQEVGITHYGDMSDLGILVTDVSKYVDSNKDISLDELIIIIELLDKLDHFEENELHPYEVPIIFNFRKLLIDLKKLRKEKSV